jgi:hypothetical protein
MGEQRTERHRARQQRRIMVWGCDIHRTPAGTECQGCAHQGELFTRADIANRGGPCDHRRPAVP